MTALIDGYDAVLFDLDGVVYLGPRRIPGALDGITGLQERGIPVGYVTNNAARPATAVVGQLVSLGFAARVEEVITSAQAAVALMRSELPAGAKVLVAGTPSLADLVAEAGLVSVERAADAPDAIIQGYDPNLSWKRLEEAAIAVQAGARWYACNTDATRPTERGLVPGAGAAVHAVGLTTPGRPTVAGKPYRPLMAEAVRRTGATRPLFVGDRLDTDIAGAHAVGIDSCLVLTGVHGKAELVRAEPDRRPSAVIGDLLGLLQPAREVQADAEGVRCGNAYATAPGGIVRIDGPLNEPGQQLDALWALAHLVWRVGPGADVSAVLAELTALH